MRVHIIGRLDHLGIALISALGEHHLDKLADHINVRALQIALLHLAKPLCAARVVRDRIAGGERGPEEIASYGLKSARIGECRQLQLTELLRVLLPGRVAFTWPYWVIVTVVALGGMVIAGCNKSPAVVTMVP